MKRRVLVAEPIGDAGIERLRSEPDIEVEQHHGIEPERLLELIADADALVVRSGTAVTAEVFAAAKRLQVVVRAGSGTDNIDLDAATSAGVVVMNTPGGNTNAATEHTMALLLALARRISRSNQALREGRWERERWLGWELNGKVLGVIGLGRIGSEVAARARAFKMSVIAYDPFLSKETAAARNIDLLPLDSVLEQADVITLHLPLAELTHDLLGAEQFARMKQGAVIVNCARGGLIDEQALLAALEAGKLGGAALDVFVSEPKPRHELVDHPLVLATPHLAASTQEAKDSIGIQAARQLLGVLDGTSFENAINVPIRDAQLLQRLGPWLQLTQRMGELQIQLVEGGVRHVAIDVSGAIDDGSPLRLAYLRGLLSVVTGADVNYVNAPGLAEQRGIRVSESRSAPPVDYTTLVTTTIETDHGTHTVRGTVLARHAPHLVEIDGIQIDAIPHGHLLILRSLDRPGVIGEIGTCCGSLGLNISGFRLGRNHQGAEALSVVTLDGPPSAEALATLRALPHILSARAVALSASTEPDAP